MAERIRYSPKVREFTEQLRAFFAAEGIATEACFDRWVWEATNARELRECRKVISIRQVLKRSRDQRRRAAR
jgi:hypothetical protein